MRLCIILIVPLFLIHSALRAQQEQPGDSASQSLERCQLAITSNLEKAIVILDGGYVGTTPFSTDSLLPGKHRVRVLHPELQNWLTESFDDSLELKRGETKALSYEFHQRVTLTSEPFDATVQLGDSVIGKTPLIIQASAGSSGLKITKSGFETASPLFLEANRSLFSIPLKNLTGNGENNDMFKSSVTNDQPRWPLIAGSILSGVFAAYLKVKADDSFADYRATGDPALLAKTNRLDTGAAVSLVVTQVQLGLFVFLLLSE